MIASHTLDIVRHSLFRCADVRLKALPLIGRDRSYSFYQVQEQERHLRQLRGAAEAERRAIGIQQLTLACPSRGFAASLPAADSERQCLNQEKEAFQAFRSQVLRELREKQYRLQVINMYCARCD